MRFIIIKNVVDYTNVIVDIIKPLVGNNLRLEHKNKDIIIYHNYDNQDEIEELLLALESGIMISILAYLSNDSSEIRLKKELQIALKLLDKLPHGVYNLKSALLQCEKVENQSDVLNFILEHSSINSEFIKRFVANDLNVSRAAKTMFIHRNTMIYKLDKLKEVSGFDLRVFKDAYILYSLIENK